MDQRVYDQWIKLGYDSALRSSWVGNLGGHLETEGLASLVSMTPSGGVLF